MKLNVIELQITKRHKPKKKIHSLLNDYVHMDSPPHGNLIKPILALIKAEMTKLYK